MIGMPAPLPFAVCIAYGRPKFISSYCSPIADRDIVKIGDGDVFGRSPTR